MDFKGSEECTNISIKKKETNYIVFNINYSTIRECTGIEYRSPVFKFKDSPAEECYISFISSSSEKKSKYGAKNAGMTLHFMRNEVFHNEPCTYQVVASILHKPEYGTHYFQSQRCGTNELKHSLFFNLCQLGKSVNKDGLVQVCFDTTRFSVGDSSSIETFLPQKAFYSDEKLFKLYCFALEDRYTDVTLKVGDEEIRAHRNILAAHSSVFDAMFNSKMIEEQTGVIPVEQFTPHVIKELLYYMYTNNVQDLSTMFNHLYEAAHFYNLIDLENLCKNYMYENITVNNATLILQIAEKYDVKSLLRKVKKFISENESQLINNSEYLSYLMSGLNVTNVAKCLTIADKYKLKDVKNQLKEYIRDNIKEVIKDSSYRYLYNTHMNLILEIDEFMANHYDNEQ
ncbi:kelch-like protein 41b [Copidosoma floridanum]|uniref:kelch-like protein 41b n=1 Tax=Copidosoma floridanum TaxID=29053 RepID=UPI0006C9DD40|nr:kelch-like protein 41b [Copidosoma floridanum]XP_023246829.1 kelch-like protein 41b [Copidosoma floridanum]